MRDPRQDEIAVDRTFQILEARSSGELAEALSGGASEPSRERRELTALLGLLLREPEPVEPRPQLKRRILAALAGDETVQVSIPRKEPPAAEVPSERPSAVAVSGPAPRLAPPYPRPPLRPRRLRWSYALAAVLAVGVLGLGAAVAWLQGQLWEQQAALAAHEGSVDQLRGELRAARQEQQRLMQAQAELGSLRQRVALVTDLRTEICALKPPTGRAPLPDARGLLYVASDHQHWYLKVEGLRPPEEGQVYQLWFVVEQQDEPVSAGTFQVREGEPVELGSPEMPPDTRAVVVTVEPRGGRSAPRGPVVLYGDQVMRLL